MAPTKSEFVEIINAPRERVWHVLFSEYGDIHVHNPNMLASHYMHGADQAQLGCVRHTQFSDTLFLDEEISEVEDGRSVTMVAVEHNLPFLRHMSATYELSDTADGQTRVKMSSYASTFPGFMIHLMRGRLGASLRKHLFGMKYYVETGKTVSMEEYDSVYQGYVPTAPT